jgi:hypothetical protein
LHITQHTLRDTEKQAASKLEPTTDRRSASAMTPPTFCGTGSSSYAKGCNR